MEVAKGDTGAAMEVDTSCEVLAATPGGDKDVIVSDRNITINFVCVKFTKSEKIFLIYTMMLVDRGHNKLCFASLVRTPRLAVSR